jgi:hypothetical protein
MALADSDDAFMRDCYACLTAIDNKIPYPNFTLLYNAATPLEAVLLAELTHARLARHINYQAEHVEVDAGVKLLFHGAETLNQVSPEKWAEFTLRVKTMRQMCAPK